MGAQRPKAAKTVIRSPAKSALKMMMAPDEDEESKNDMNSGDLASTPAELIEFFFVECANLMVASDPNINKQALAEWSALDHSMALSAEIKRNLCLDFVMFLRSLLSNEKWKHFVLEILFNSLQNAANLIHLSDAQVDVEQMQSVKILMTSLAVLGGHGDRVRAGCRVKLKINEEDDAAMAEQGTCIALNRSSGICQVLFDNVKRPVTIQISQIIPISEVSALGIIPIYDELLKYLTIFTEPLHFESRKPKESESET